MAQSKLLDTTVSDFGGGWNVADSPLNLSSRFQPVSENILRGVNGSFSPRWGYELYVDTRDGTAVTVTPGGAITVNVTNGKPHVRFTVNAHGYSNGDHITIPNTITLASGSLGTIPISALYGTFGIQVVDANNFRIATAYNATSTTSGTVSVSSYVIDDHTLAGDIIHQQYFKEHMLLFDDVGEIALMSEATKTAVRIWDLVTADALSTDLAPTRQSSQVSSTTFKSTVISCNGYDNDKPLQIDENFNVEFLVDKATLSNAAVPRADIVIGLNGYVIFLRTEYGDPFAEFSARNTDGTFTREPSPDDAVEVDLSMVTDTVEPIILGAAPLREQLYVAFYDRGMVGTIGVYNADGEHVPDFGDIIAEHGTISHRTIAPLGNDIILADYAGVPSISISLQSGVYTPSRVSELIAPAIQKHLANLSEATLKSKAFGFYNRSDRMYMLFVPKCDEVVQSLEDNPLIFTRDLSSVNRTIVRARKHKLFEGSYVQVAGATTIDTLLANQINGKRQVVHVIDDDTFIMQVDTNAVMPPQTTMSGGGTALTITPINDETICYGFEYNKELKIRRWTRLRGMNFDCAGVTQRGRVYFAKGGRVYRYGNSEEPIYADNVNGWSTIWQQNAAYNVGDLVYDALLDRTYECLIAHTSPATGTFEDSRDDDPNNWQEYAGAPINWVLETPWSDLQKRGQNKIIKYIGHDIEGTDEFTFSIYTNQLYRDRNKYERIPARTMEFTAGGYAGFGIGNDDVYSSGRRTREEKVWPMPAKGKLFMMRYEGATTRSVRITGTTLYYLVGGNK